MFNALRLNPSCEVKGSRFVARMLADSLVFEDSLRWNWSPESIAATRRCRVDFSLAMVTLFVFLFSPSHFDLHSDPRCLRQSNALNLHVDALGKLLDGDTAPGRFVLEPLGVLKIHLL